MDLPYGTGRVRWLEGAVAPGGCSWVPGPTDTELFGDVALDSAGWKTLEGKTGPATARGQVRVPEAIAEAIFDATQLAGIPTDGDVRVVEGPRIPLDALLKRACLAEAVRWKDVLVLRLASQ